MPSQDSELTDEHTESILDQLSRLPGRSFRVDGAHRAAPKDTRRDPCAAACASDESEAMAERDAAVADEAELLPDADVVISSETISADAPALAEIRAERPAEEPAAESTAGDDDVAADNVPPIESEHDIEATEEEVEDEHEDAPDCDLSREPELITGEGTDDESATVDDSTSIEDVNTEDITDEADSPPVEDAPNDADTPTLAVAQKEKKTKKRRGGMVRWKYLVPRAAILLLLLLGAWLLLNPGLHWALVAFGQSQTGAKVEIASLRTSLRDASFQMQGIAIADPKAEMKNLVEIDSVRIDLDGARLLRKKYVVTEASLTGLRFDTDRTTSGWLPKVEKTEAPTPDTDNADDDSLKKPAWVAKGQEWGGEQLSAIGGRVDEQLGRFTSIQLATTLPEKWRGEYDMLYGKAKSIEGRIAQLRTMYENRRAAMQNPADAFALSQQALTELNALRTEAEQVTARLETLRTAYEKDRNEVLSTAAHDLAQIQAMVQQFQTNPDEISELLLGDVMSERVANITAWIKRIKTLIPDGEKTAAKDRVQRTSGIDILFSDTDAYPRLVIERMTLTGETDIEGRPYQFRGNVTDITTNPKQLGRPTVCNLVFDGEAPAKLDIVIDATGERVLQKIDFLCERLPIPSQTLGRPEKLAMNVSPSQMTLAAQLIIDGDQIAGVVEMRQPDVRLTVATREGTTLAKWTPYLQQTINPVSSVAATVHVSGTLKSPQWKLRSNLGDQVSAGLKQVVDQELAMRRQQLSEGLRNQLNAQLASLDQYAAMAQAEIQKAVRLDDQTLGQLGTLLGGNNPTASLQNHVMGAATDAIDRQLKQPGQDAIRRATGEAEDRIRKEISGQLPGGLPKLW